MSSLISASRVGRATPLLLLLSVALNLLLVGAFLGRWAMPFPPPPHGGDMTRHIIEDMSRGMSPADQAILLQAYQAHAQSQPDHRAEHQAALDGIRHALAATPFDLAALRQAINAAVKLDADRHGQLEQILLDAAPQMSEDGRQHMAAWQPGGPPPPGPGPGPDGP